MVAKIKMITAMTIFGTIGIIVSSIPLTSTTIALSRAIIGTTFLAVVMLVTRQKPAWAIIRRKWPLLLISGIAIGINWIFLFEAYRYTTVAVATLCYYMAPVFVTILSPLVLKERLTWLKGICTVTAVFGAVMVSGTAMGQGINIRGIFFGLAAAELYCSVVLMNKFMTEIPPMETTVCQLGAAAIVLVPYTLLTQNLTQVSISYGTWGLILIVGILNTGIAYYLYFTSLKDVPGQTAAVFSYIDPMVAVFLSVCILHETITLPKLCGMVLILGSTCCNELFTARIGNDKKTVKKGK